MTEFVVVSVAISVVYLAIVYAIDFLLVGFAFVENAVRTSERRTDDFELAQVSPFAIPVSIVVPVRNEEAVVVPVVRSLLSLRYAAFEVILVNDASTDRTLELLRDEFELEPREVLFRRVVPGSDIRRTYRSRLDERLLVVDNQAPRGNKAVALNTGLNFCRYRYVCFVDGDTIYSDDALLQGMRLALRDPERVIGVTSQIAVTERPEERIARGREERLAVGLLTRFQHIEYLRSFLNDRLAWSRLGFMLCVSGAFMLWRRDVLVQLGGFSPDFSCEDIEFTFRAHEHCLRNGIPYEIVALPDAVAWTEGPTRLRSLIAQRERWHRVVLETVWHYRRMTLRRRYGAVGLIGMPFYLVSEVVAPVFEVLAILSLVAAAVVGILDPLSYALFFGTMAFILAIFTSAAVLLDDRVSRSYAVRDIARVLVLGPAELALYRPVLVWARLRAMWSFARGDRSWGKFERNPRRPASAA